MAKPTAQVAVGTTTPVSGKGSLVGFIVNPGTAATTVTIRDGGGGGTIIAGAVAAANASSFYVAVPAARFETDLTIVVAGAAATAQAYYE